MIVLMRVGNRKVDPMCWSPELVLTGSAALPGTTLLSQLAEIIEGKRNVTGGGDVPGDRLSTYGQANVGVLRWHLDAAQFLTRPQVDRAAVQPGDIVVNKILPLRAAWVSPRLRRHPVDANCILIRGLETATSFWTAVCLNQPLYKDHLAAAAEGAVLARLKVRSLRDLPILPTPEECRPIAATASAVLDQLIAAEETLRREVAAAEERITPPEVLRFWEDRVTAIDNHSWWRRIPGEMIQDSLSPSHALFEVLRQELQANFGWVPIKQCILMPEQGRKEYRQRLTGSSESTVVARCLRISDVDSDFTVATAPPPEQVDWPGRVYQMPLQPHQVLVSLLVSSPKVAYAGKIPAPDIHLTDHWERLVFRETPGAWAIVLNSALVRIQLRLLAQGSARQFLGSGSLDQVVVPDLTREERVLMHRSLNEYQQSRLASEREWTEVLTQAEEVFRTAHKPALTESQPKIIQRHAEARQ